MGEYHSTVRLTDSGADVRFGQVNFLVSQNDDVKVGHNCPVVYIAGALGS